MPSPQGTCDKTNMQPMIEALPLIFCLRCLVKFAMTSRILLMIIVSLLCAFWYNDVMAQQYQNRLFDHHWKNPNDASDEQSYDFTAYVPQKT